MYLMLGLTQTITYIYIVAASGASELLAVPSLTLITIPLVVPTFALPGVPLRYS